MSWYSEDFFLYGSLRFTEVRMSRETPVVNVHQLVIVALEQLRLCHTVCLQVLSRGCPHALQQLFFFVHEGIGAFQYIVEAGILPAFVIGEATRDDDALSADVLYRAIMKLLHELLADEVVMPLEDGHELVAPDPVHRAVLEDFADHPARA